MSFLFRHTQPTFTGLVTFLNCELSSKTGGCWETGPQTSWEFCSRLRENVRLCTCHRRPDSIAEPETSLHLFIHHSHSSASTWSHWSLSTVTISCLRHIFILPVKQGEADTIMFLWQGANIINTVIFNDKVSNTQLRDRDYSSGWAAKTGKDDDRPVRLGGCGTGGDRWGGGWRGLGLLQGRWVWQRVSDRGWMDEWLLPIIKSVEEI